MWVTVFVFFYFKGFVFGFKFDGNALIYAQILVSALFNFFNFFFFFRSIGFFYRLIGKFSYLFYKATLFVYQRHFCAIFIHHKNTRNACYFCNSCIVGTKGWRNMYYTRTVRSGYKITCNYGKGRRGRLHIRH